MRAVLTSIMLCGLLATPAFAQSSQETSASGATEPEELVPGLEVLTEALKQGGFTDVRVAGQDFVLVEMTHPQAGTVYLLINREGGAPIAPAGTGTPAPDLGASATGSEPAEAGSNQ
jgi:hypothetical protein